jgi:hypothetical protein
MSDATIVSGSIKSVSIHGREFPVDAGCDARLNIGGVQNTLVVFGSGNAAFTQEQKGWFVEDLDVCISDDRGDLGFLAQAFNAVVGNIPIGGLQIPAPPTGPDRGFLTDVAELGAFIPIGVTLVDDTTWAGAGNVVGPIDTSSRSGIAKLSLAGRDRLIKQ